MLHDGGAEEATSTYVLAVLFFVQFRAQGTSCRVDIGKNMAAYRDSSSPKIETEGLNARVALDEPEKRTQG
jgi:hypothetical protein